MISAKYTNEENTIIEVLFEGGSTKFISPDSPIVDLLGEQNIEIQAYTPPQKTQDQLDDEAKLAGVEFEGVMCSATSKDMWGLAAIKDDVAAGMPVNFHFDNGNKLVLTNANMAAFEAVWKPFRASFYPID